MRYLQSVCRSGRGKQAMRVLELAERVYECAS